jgi:predicted RNA-binding protein
VNFWIVTTTEGSWEITKTRSVHAFNREVDRNKVNVGDKIVCYLVRSDPPVFVGIDEITKPWEEAKEPFWPEEREEGKVMWPWRFWCTPLKRGAADARSLSKRLSFVENKDAWSAYFIGSLANFGRPILESDYQLISEELDNPPIAYQVKPAIKPKVPTVAKILPRREIPQLRGPVPSHNELRDMIRDIGVMKKLVAETEYPINDLRLDVIWRTEVQKIPSRVWEVHLAGNFYEALAKLKHAWDYWRAEPILVTTEKSEDEARSRLGGIFHEIKPHIRIIHWQDVVRLYKLTLETTWIEHELGL